MIAREGAFPSGLHPAVALVNEKWMTLCRELGPESVGLATGDATVNRDAPVLCCTAEILADIALREGKDELAQRGLLSAAVRSS